jgi:hypothetical protein
MDFVLAPDFNSLERGLRRKHRDAHDGAGAAKPCSEEQCSTATGLDVCRPADVHSEQ